MKDDSTGAGGIPEIPSDRLAEENRELKLRLQYLATRQTSLEQRLERVENSIVFRFLRWLGPKLGVLGLSADGYSPFLPASRVGKAKADQHYAAWLEKTAWKQALQEPAAVPAVVGAQPQSRKLVSIVLDATHPDRSRLVRALASLNLQVQVDWELLVCPDPAPPAWLEVALDPIRSGRTVEIVSGGTEAERLEAAVKRCKGEFIAIVSGDAILEPDTLQEWLAAAEPGAAAVYSDWDFISPEGRRHTPRFTPECSPELLSQTLYWGVCYLARTTAVQESWSRTGSTLSPVHDLAVRLADGRREVRRVPKVLWHVQDGVPDPAALGSSTTQNGTKNGRANAPRGADQRANAAAAIVICSRNEKLLERCLKSLRPTLRPQDEVIVVAHQAGDAQALQRTALESGARVVPYEGAFHFGQMNRLGVTASTAPLICLLNDDIIPLAHDWLPRMLAQASRTDVGVVGALLLYPDGTIEHAGIAVGGRHSPAHVGRFQQESPYWPWLRVTREVTAVTGACMMLRRTVWEELNGFDRRFPVNYNDVDLCLRAAERGYKVLLEARAVLTHEGCGTRTPTVKVEENELLYKLWWPVMNATDRFFNPQFGNEIEPILLGTTNGFGHRS